MLYDDDEIWAEVERLWHDALKRGQAGVFFQDMATAIAAMFAHPDRLLTAEAERWAGDVQAIRSGLSNPGWLPGQVPARLWEASQIIDTQTAAATRWRLANPKG